MLVNGPAGSSKTLLATYCALQLLNMKVISDIMYLRSAVESSDRSLGYLTGSADEKLRFFNLPFIDKLEELLETTRAEKLEQEGRVSMFPVNFARGMNWKGKCIILDEAQNSTTKEITTVLTRLGKEANVLYSLTQCRPILSRAKSSTALKKCLSSSQIKKVYLRGLTPLSLQKMIL